MEIITSPDNSQVKAISKLKDKKYRLQLNKYVIEGYRNVVDSLSYLNNSKVYMSESAFSKYGQEFIGATVCSDNVFAKMSDTSTSQGILVVADIDKKPLDYFQNCMFLDRVSDPGNVGTIMRSCVATGFDNLICFGGADAYNPKTVRSAMSAVCKLNVLQTDTLSVLEELKEQGYLIVSADMGGENIYETMLTDKKICLIIGNEANGISDEVEALSDKIVSLPMGKVESLNAAVCASVLMYTIKYGK